MENLDNALYVTCVKYKRHECLKVKKKATTYRWSRQTCQKTLHQLSSADMGLWLEAIALSFKK